MKTCVWGLIFMLTGFLSFPAAKAAEQHPLQLHKLYTEAHLKPGENGLLKIHLTLKPGHKAYVDQFDLKSSNLKNLKNTQLKPSKTTPFLDPHTQKMREVVTKDFSLETVIEIPEDLKQIPASIDLELRYQACTLKYCYTPKTLKMSLPQS